MAEVLSHSVYTACSCKRTESTFMEVVSTYDDVEFGYSATLQCPACGETWVVTMKIGLDDPDKKVFMFTMIQQKGDDEQTDVG